MFETVLLRWSSNTDHPKAAVQPTAADTVAPTNRVVFFSLLSAAFSVAATAGASYHHPIPWTALLSGLIVALAGFQIANARRLFALSTPAAIRSWMTPASRACYSIGIVLALLGVRALFSLSRAG
jgi:hypothetical protein